MENTKTGKRIPIKEAKEIGVKNGYNQVIITAWDINTNTTSVCTWGKSMEDCDQAAQGGNFVKKALGWPEKLTNEKPSRVKKLERETTQLREENERLMKSAQKLVDWNTKYPPGKIYSYGSAKVMESELQELVSESEQILYDIENKKPNNY